jgi:polar amino acid transport system ATP-binding protein
MEKHFGDNVILQNVNCEIEKGEVIAIIGPSGTGKSTLLRCLNMLEPPTGGQIIFNGTNLTAKGADINAARLKMGMVFQNFGLFSHLDVMDNLVIGPMRLMGISHSEAETRAVELLKTVGLTERAHHFPQQLSGGQKQRVAIARCLTMQPEVILFDEPTSALDPTMVGEVMAVIRSLAHSGMTMLVVTHEMSFARDISSRVFYMDEGGIYEDAPPKVIFEEPTREKTRNFIFKIRSFEYAAQSRDFDYVAMLSGIDNFCFRHAIDKKIWEKLRLVAEELVINLVMPRFPSCHLTVSFSEKLSSYEVTVSYPGASVNILDEPLDEISASIVRKTAREAIHSYTDGTNVFKIVV